MKKIISLLITLLSTGNTNVSAYPMPHPFPPFRIAGNLYYVGTDDLANYLIVTPKGNILINSDFPQNVAMIKASIEKLGFHYKDTKILLISHAHSDHAAGSALIKQQTGAKYMVMDADVANIESGGKTDFFYSNDPTMIFKPAKVDKVLHDGDKVELGGTTLVAHRTPGHTKGNTTWTMQVTDHGKQYNVVIIGSTSVNPGYQLVNNKTYPNIATDYEHTMAVLTSLPADIYLGAHAMYFNLQDKYKRLQLGDKNALVDPQGYRQFVAKANNAFHAELKKQQNSL